MSTNHRKNSYKKISENHLTGQLSDEFNIKAHLNTSLDLSGITVNEELIQKTLNAIKDNEADLIKEEVTADNASIQRHQRKTRIIKYSRIFAGVAAAAIIFVVGINNIGMGKKNSSDMNYSLMSNGTAANEATASDSTDQASTDRKVNGTQEGKAPKAERFAMSEDADTGSGTTYNGDKDASVSKSASEDSSDVSIKFDMASSADAGDSIINKDGSSSSSAKSPGPTNTPADNNTADTAGTLGAQLGIAAITGDATTSTNLSFQDIVPAKLIQISAITITDDTADKKTSLTLQTDIQNFYNTLEQQQFTTGTESDNSYRYTIKVYGSDSQDLFTMEVGDTVTISPAPNETDNSGIYIAPDQDAFLELIATFCK